MPAYKYAGAFSEGRATVNIPDTTKNIIESETLGDYGIIDTIGNVIVPPKYLFVFPYNNGYSWAFIVIHEDDFSLYRELLDKGGNSTFGLLPLSGGAKLSDFSDNGWAAIKWEVFSLKFCSFVDVNLQFLTDFNNDGAVDFMHEAFEDVKSFNENYAPVKYNGKWVFIDDKCTILSEEYDSTGLFSEGYARVMFNGAKDNQWGYVDTTFNLVIPYKFSECSDFHDGLAYFKIINTDDITEGYINKQGTVVWSKSTKEVHAQKELKNIIKK